MAKPLISADPTPKSVQFSHFGVLNDGANKPWTFAVSTIGQVLILLLLIIIGNAVKNVVAPPKNKLDTLVVPIKDQPKPPPPPKPLPQPPKPLPEPPKIEPKIQPPKPVPLPPEIKPVIVPVPKVNLAPPAPKKVDPPPAPKVVNLANAKAASIPNNDPHPSAVRLGRTDSPIKSSMTGPPVSRVNLSAGVPGMPAGNTGNGPASKSVNLGSGSPQGTNLNGRSNAVTPVKGFNNGVPGGTGTGRSGPVVVQIAPPAAAAPAAHAPTVASPLAKPPVVTFVPKPVYSAEAKSMHLEGDAQVKVNFRAGGSVEVLGLSHGLGHGLDQAALQAAQGIRFKPATDAAGHPIDYPTTVTVHFVIN